MGKFIGVIAATLTRENDAFVQTTEILEFVDETWIYYCRPHLGAPRPGWRDLADGTLRLSYTPPPIRHDEIAWEPRVIEENAGGTIEYTADAFEIEPGNNLFHLALPPGYLPIAGSWDVPPLYGHADGGRFVIGWGGFEPAWPAFRFEPVEEAAFRDRAAALDRAIERDARERRRAVLDPWRPATEVDAAALLRQMDRRLSLEEVRTLTFELGVDYDNLGGDTKVAKIRELLRYLDRQSQLGRLVAHLHDHYAFVLSA